MFHRVEEWFHSVEAVLAVVFSARALGLAGSGGPTMPRDLLARRRGLETRCNGGVTGVGREGYPVGALMAKEVRT